MTATPTTYLAAGDETPMWVPGMDVVVSSWFTGYHEARAALARGGYLFQYRGQYFVTGPEAVRQLGMDPDDPDWSRIGFDWVRPRDLAAWERLRFKRLIAG